jgi:hypothetical protein
MKTLTIKDLARTEQLGRDAMAAVRGGYKMDSYKPSYSPSYSFAPPSYPSGGDSSIHVDQDLQQLQSVVNSTANGSGFLSGVHATNDTSQFGQNNVLVYR